MIAALAGRLIHKSPTHLIVDVHGVGYEVIIPLSTFYSLPNVQEVVSLAVHTHLRDDAIQLFGFLTELEKDAFVLLTGVSGIGPRLALSVLSSLSVPDLVSAIRAGDLEKLGTVPGIGKKSAGRIVLELKDKVERLGAVVNVPVERQEERFSQLEDDAVSALVNLGYRAADVKHVLARLGQSAAPPDTLPQLIKEALKSLARG